MAESTVMCQWSASVVLYPGSSITFSDKLESIQGFAAKLCTKQWSDPPTVLDSDLNWPTLCSRQKVLLCRRIIRNKSIISPSPYFFPPPHPNPRTHHPHTVHVLFARTTSFQSFFTQQLHTISAAVCSKLKNQTDTDFDAGYGTDSGYETDSKYTSSSTNKSDICGGAGWRRIAYLDMTDPNTTCPSGWKLTTYSKRTCGRVYSWRYTCDAVIFPVSAREYSRVCGRIKAYQYGYTVAFRNSSIDTAYLSGVSITHGYPREHIWSFAAGKSELDHDRYVCPCEANRNRSVPFIGTDYFCESGKHHRWGQRGTPSYILYADDPLWDGKNCLRGICCAFNNPPYFIKKLTMPSTNYIEVRICGTTGNRHDDTPIQLIELYVK